PARRSGARPRAQPNGHRRGRRSSFPATHHLDLGLELDAEPSPDLGLHLLDQRAHVGRLRAALVDDEVAVELADHRMADARALEPGGLDEASRGIARRVLEDAAAVLRLDRLRFIALAGQPRHRLPRLLPIAALELDRRVDDKRALQRAFAQRRGAVAELQVGGRPRLAALAGHEAAGLDQHLAQLLPPAARVLVDGAADGAGHADRELKTAQVGVGRRARDAHHLQPRAGAHARAFDRELAVDDPDDEALDAGVGDEQVGARAQQQMRDLALDAALDDLLQRLRLR